MSAHDVLAALGLSLSAPVILPVKATPHPKTAARLTSPKEPTE